MGLSREAATGIGVCIILAAINVVVVMAQVLIWRRRRAAASSNTTRPFRCLSSFFALDRVDTLDLVSVI